jgi:prolyl-tRNA editing enzyme YbaK/EbsC (Cys-tRNA(Pro) deacylase)
VSVPPQETEWPPAVERVAGVLREARIESRVEQLDEGTATAADAAAAVGCGLAQIVKSLLFACDDRWTLALVPGDRRADRVKVAAAAGAERARTAGPEDVARITGFPAGGVAPFPLPGVHTVLIEQTMLSHDVVWIGAGSPVHVAALTPADLIRLSRARTVDLVSEN